jgi:2-polyprenyl-3-methyl-5-hydroxy-6-metoxy-1,4-benzoquinol methylase
MAASDSEDNGYRRRAQFYRVEFCESRDIEFYLANIQENKTEVLEIPCGAGRLTAELARRAKHVTAVDIEPHMLESLQNHLNAIGLNEKVSCLLGDMTKIQLGPIFDLIIVPSEALQLVPKTVGKTVLACLTKNLKPGGLLIVDTATFNCRKAGDPDYFDPATIGATWINQWTRPLPGAGTLNRSVRTLKDYEKVVFEFLYKLSEDGSVSEQQFTETMTLYLYERQWFFENIPPEISEISVRPYYDEMHDLSQPSRLIVSLRKCEGSPT